MALGKLTKVQVTELERWSTVYEEAVDKLAGAVQEILDEWQTGFDEKSDAWQRSNRGVEVGSRMAGLQELIDQLLYPNTPDISDLSSNLP